MSDSQTNKYHIFRDREMILTPCYWNAVLQTSEAVKDIYGVTLGTECNDFANGRMRSFNIKEEDAHCSRFIADKILSDKQYFKNIKDKTIIAEKEILNFLIASEKKDYSTYKFEDLISETKEIQRLFMQYDAASVFSWFIAGDLLREEIQKKTALSKNDFDIVSLPEQKTQATQMDIDILNAVVKSEDFVQTARELSKKYYWMPYGYDGPNIFDEKHFLDRLNSESQEKAVKDLEKLNSDDNKNKIEKKRILETLSDEGRYLINVLNTITVWTDDRKMLGYSIFYYYGLILKELEKRFNFPVLKLKCLLTEELADLENNVQGLLDRALERQTKPFLIIVENAVLRFANEAEANEIRGEINKQISSDVITGTVASRGNEKKYKALVKVLLSPKECDKVLEGDFLVATMTSPDYVIAMKKAIGFITDEGGVTCHAAIVARELKKPCIIGTKIATKILKDGDMVEIDIDSGVVRIIK